MTDSERLEANLSPETAADFRGLLDTYEMNLNEGARAAIKIWKTLDNETAAGNMIAAVERGGSIRQITGPALRPVPCICPDHRVYRALAKTIANLLRRRR